MKQDEGQQGGQAIGHPPGLDGRQQRVPWRGQQRGGQARGPRVGRQPDPRTGRAGGRVGESPQGGDQGGDQRGDQRGDQVARPGIVAPDLVRVLGGLLEQAAPPAASRTAFADALASWTGWTDAIALSAALDRPDDIAACRAPSAGTAAARFERERAHCDSVRVRLALSIDAEVDRTGRSDIDLAQGRLPFRQCHIAQQQALGTAVGGLRDRVRTALARGDAGQIRLAALDAALTPVLGAQERRLLGKLPALLDRHHAARQARAEAEEQGEKQAEKQADKQAEKGSGQAGNPGQAQAEAGRSADGGLDAEALRRDLRALLHAELALRLQPIEGLLAALRPSTLDIPS